VHRGALDEARDVLEQSLQASRSAGRRRWEAWRLVELAALARLQGENGSVTSLADQAQPMFEAIGDAEGLDEVKALKGG
jgi:type II secretory pathway component PulL